MIILKNKPMSLFVAGPVLGIGILMSIGYVIYGLVSLVLNFEGLGLGLVILVPALLYYLAQIIFYLALGYVLLVGIYKWSNAAIILGVIVAPLVLAIVSSSIANQFDQSVDLSTSTGTGVLIFYLLTPLIMAAVAYNDIRYRKPLVLYK